MKKNEIKKIEIKNLIIYILWIYLESMISSFIYLCALIFEKTHLDLITCQKTQCFIYVCVEIDSSYLQDINAWSMMVNLGAMKDLEPFIIWCLQEEDEKKIQFTCGKGVP